MSQRLKVTVAFDPSPSELDDQAGDLHRHEKHGYIVEYMVGVPGGTPPARQQMHIPVGTYQFSVEAAVGEMVDAYISYVDAKGIRSKSVRYMSSITGSVEPQPPARLRMAAVVPIVAVSEPTTQPAVPVKIPDGTWVAVNTNGQQATVRSVDQDGRSLHLSLDENTNFVIDVIDNADAIDHVLTPKGERISFNEFLQEIGLASR